jgi:hypothetical protein
VPPEAALSERSEQIAQRAIAEEVQALVSDLEAVLLGIAHAAAAARAFALLAFLRQVGRSGQVALRLQLFDDLLDQRIEPLFRIFRCLPVLAEQPLQHFIGQHAAV